MIKYKSRNIYRNESEENCDSELPIGSPINLGEDLAAEKGNDVYLYEEITTQSVLKTIKQIEKKVLHYKKLLLENNLVDTSFLSDSVHIKLHINSYGGSASDSFNLHDYIKKSKTPIYTYVEGTAASAATLISIAGTVRYITSNSIMMIHQLSSWFGGKYEEFKDEKSNLDLYMNIIKNIYLSNTNLKSKKLETLLKRDLYLSADKCLEYGLVDYIN